MADKQIIIDVQECEFWQEGHCDCYADSEISDTYPHCIDIPDCYYKQLKRKEQECEKAKQNAQDTYDIHQALMESFNILQDEKIKIEQECERLKRQNKKLKHSFKELNVYIEKAQEWLKKQKLNDIFVDEMRVILLEELKCLKKK